MAGGHHVPLPACEAKLASASTPTSGAPPKTSASAAILIPTGVAAALERQEVDRVGRVLAVEWATPVSFRGCLLSAGRWSRSISKRP